MEFTELPKCPFCQEILKAVILHPRATQLRTGETLIVVVKAECPHCYAELDRNSPGIRNIIANVFKEIINP